MTGRGLYRSLCASLNDRNSKRLERVQNIVDLDNAFPTVNMQVQSVGFDSILSD